MVLHIKECVEIEVSVSRAVSTLIWFMTGKPFCDHEMEKLTIRYTNLPKFDFEIGGNDEHEG